MMVKKGLKGVGGWLWFFAFILSVLIPLFSLISILFFLLIILGLNLPIITFLLIIYPITIGTISFIVGISIFTKKEKSIVLAKEFTSGLLAGNIINLIIEFILIPIKPENFISAIIPLIVLIVFLVYLNKSQRIKNTFKLRKINWKRISIILIAVVIICIIITLTVIFSVGIYLHNNYPMFNRQENGTIKGALPSNYVNYYPFENQNISKKIDLKFISDQPISVYFVPSEKDSLEFLRYENYNIYRGCSFENKTSYEINCNVTTGGIVVYNNGLSTATYQILNVNLLNKS